MKIVPFTHDNVSGLDIKSDPDPSIASCHACDDGLGTDDESLSSFLQRLYQLREGYTPENPCRGGLCSDHALALVEMVLRARRTEHA